MSIFNGIYRFSLIEEVNFFNHERYNSKKPLKKEGHAVPRSKNTHQMIRSRLKFFPEHARKTITGACPREGGG